MPFLGGANIRAYLKPNQRGTWSSVITMNRVGQLVLNASGSPLFCCNRGSLCRVALLTTDGAIFHSVETGDRLLAAWRKIKNRILLEK